jgi:hypothetical protein
VRIGRCAATKSWRRSVPNRGLSSGPNPFQRPQQRGVRAAVEFGAESPRPGLRIEGAFEDQGDLVQKPFIAESVGPRRLGKQAVAGVAPGVAALDPTKDPQVFAMHPIHAGGTQALLDQAQVFRECRAESGLDHRSFGSGGGAGQADEAGGGESSQGRPRAAHEAVQVEGKPVDGLRVRREAWRRGARNFGAATAAKIGRRRPRYVGHRALISRGVKRADKEKVVDCRGR